MSHANRLYATADVLGKVLEFPVRPSTDTPPALPGLAVSSAENLILQATHLLERVVHLAGSLDEEQRLSVYGHLLTLEVQVLDPLQLLVERHRAFMSDLSAKQAKQRRRRRKRVTQVLEIIPAIAQVIPALTV